MQMLRRIGRHGWTRIAAVSVAATLLAVGTVTAAQSATPTTELMVDSLAQTADAKPGDGTCADATGACTLRAAIQESNTLDRAPGAVSIGVAEGFAGGKIPISATTSTWMRTTSVATGGAIGGDGGAVFSITAPVTIDLDHRITASTDADNVLAALFYVNADSVSLAGVDDSYTSETTFYVGPDASNVHIGNGSVRTANYYPERFFVVRGGAEAVTFSDYTVQGYAASAGEWGWGYVDGAGTTAVDGLTVERMHYVAGTGGRCDGSGADGCSSAPVSAQQQKVTRLRFADNRVDNLNRGGVTVARGINLTQSTVGDLVVVDNTFTNPFVPAGQALVDMGTGGYAATMGDVTITGNTISGAGSGADEMNGLIRFPGSKGISGKGLVSGNTFSTSGKQASGMHAIYWWGPFGDAVNVTSSRLVIEDNRFDGFGSANRSTIRMYQTGSVTMQRNTFGTNTLTQADTTREEGIGTGSYDPTMVNNWSYGANGKLNTWYPTARTSANVQAAPILAQQCTVAMEIAPPGDAQNTTDLTAARYPSDPARVDVYWTAGTSAEVFLESVDVSGQARRTVEVTLPLPDDDRLAALPAGATLPVDPTTGAVSGGLRLQTQDTGASATTASSQFSRVAAIAGTCRPELTIDQAKGQNDPTMGRDLHWTLTSTMALDPATVTAADVTLAASPTAETTDAARINARVVSVTPAADGEDRRYDVIARVDDSATVTATVGPDAVTNTVGLANSAAATSTDPDVTYVNPLALAPGKLTVVTGDTKAKQYRLQLRGGPPVPSDDLDFTTKPDDSATANHVTVSPARPVISGGETVSGRIDVSAAAGDVAAGTAAAIGHRVTSRDGNYDGLVVPSLRIALFSTDPSIQIVKQAYTDVTDASAPATIQATGTEAPKDARVIDGQNVCFVYTVKNVSKDDWATTLTDALVTDSDTRLGKNGVIGTIPRIPIGGSAQLAACGTMIPVDTTAGSTR